MVKDISFSERDLAKAFSKGIRNTLRPSQLAAVNRLNAKETDPDICHSHDFCDANVVMIEAVTSLLEMSEGEFLALELHNDDEMGRLIDKAWKLAKVVDFNEKHLKD